MLNTLPETIQVEIGNIDNYEDLIKVMCLIIEVQLAKDLYNMICYLRIHERRM